MFNIKYAAIIGATALATFAATPAQAERIQLSALQGTLYNAESGAMHGNSGGIQTRYPGKIPTSVTFSVYAKHAGPYQLAIKYAAAEPRPVLVTVNGAQIDGNAASATTGGWTPTFAIESMVGEVELREGHNSIMLSRGSDIPHIHGIVLNG